MGYIAPITNYQYQQYAERVISKRYNPYQFVPISTIKALINPEVFDDHNEKPFINKPTQKITVKIKPEEKTIEKIYSEITGIGSLYNEFV